MNKILEKFSRWLEVNGKSYNSRRSYISLVKELLSKLPIENLTEETLQDYLWKKQQTTKPSTGNQHRKAIRHFLKFLKLDIMLPKGLKVKKPEGVEYFTLEYFENNIIPMVEVLSKNSIKDKTILYFYLFTGLRKNDILLVKRKDINFTEKEVRVYFQKVNKTRILPLTNKLIKLIKIYYEIEPEEKENAFNMKKGTIANIINKLKPYFKDVRININKWRHSYATHLIDQGIAVTDVQYLMGHNDIRTTMIYAHTNIKGLKKRFGQKMEGLK